MLLDKKGYSYNDITIIPEVISNVSSRQECDPFIRNNSKEKDLLPIFASPMASVISNNNYEDFLNNKIMPIIPRNIPLEARIELMEKELWVALSLKEFEKLFIEQSFVRLQKKYYICVDIANGHMKSLYDKCKKAKDLSDINNYVLTIMTGNIANPETYEWICKFNEDHNKRIIDYIRVGIGGGSGCFIDGTKVKTKNGEKNIEEISNGEYVMTIDGTYQKVINTIRYKTNEFIKINNEITSTLNHKYFVINKEDKDKVNEDNLQKYGYWVEANKLDKNNHLLVKKY